MRKTILLILCIFLLAISAFFISSVDMSTTTTTTTDKWIQQETYNEMNATGEWLGTNGLANLYDGNKSTCSIPHNASTYKVDYTKLGDNYDTLSTSVWEVTYNSSTSIVTENLTIPSACRNAYTNKYRFKIEMNATLNISNDITFENFTWLNGTAVSLANTRIESGIVFNRTINIGVVNESNATNSNLIWLNGTNMTLTNTNLVDTSTVKVMNCTSPQAEFGSGNYTAYGDGNIFALSNATIPDGEPICVNYTYVGVGFGNVIASGNYTLDYLSGAITLTSNLHNNTLMGINYTYMTDGDPINDRWCYNDSAWIKIGSTSSSAAVCEEGMQFEIGGRSWTVTMGLTSPLGIIDSEYYPSDAAAISFNWTYTDTLADENHTTLNCSIYTRLNSTANYTVNVSDIVTDNGSYANATLTFGDGDRVWWYLSCEDNYSRTIVNSTPTRILDIDIDYYTQCLGQNCEVNISFGTGDITTIGDITASTFIGDIVTGNGTGESGNFTWTQGCWFAFDMGTMYDTNCTRS